MANLEAAAKSLKERQTFGLKGHNFCMKETLKILKLGASCFRRVIKDT